MRISDEDRQRTLDELRRHSAAGRLGMEEYGSRVEEALAATTLGHLDHALRDLPMVRIPNPGSGEPPGSAAVPGLARGSAGEEEPGWRGAGRRALGAGNLGAAGTAADRPSRWHLGRLTALVAALLGIAVVLAAAGLAATAHVVWAVLLVVGWLLGLLQGRGSAARRR